MADPLGKKSIKVGVKEGGGPSPGYFWNVMILDQAFGDAKSFLNDDQYDHLARQIKELAKHEDPTHSLTIDIRAIEDYYELRDKGGLLGRINVRIFYFVHYPDRAIVVLGAIKKENNGPTPIGDKVTMQRRKRLYLQNHGPGS